MPLAPGDIVHVWWRMKYENQEYQLHHNYRVESGNSTQATLLDLGELASELGVTVGNNSPTDKLLPVMAANVEISNINVQRVAPNRSPYVTLTINGNGTHVNNAETGNIAGILSLFTDFPGRDQVSNKHVGPLPGNTYAGGVIDGAYVVLLNTLATALLAQQTIQSGNTLFNPVIWHTDTDTADILIGRRIGDRVRIMNRRTLRIGI